MPTGYTADIHSGKPFTFRQYALGCARAFGALVEMRDEPMDAPITDKLFRPSTYHVEHVASAEKRLAELKALTEQQAQPLADADYNERYTAYQESIEKRKAMIARYDAMLEQARAYHPPTPEHVEYGKFMVKQLVDSKEWDTSYLPEKPYRIPAIKWLEQQIDKEQWNVDYHTKELAKEEMRHNDRSGWVKAMLDSLPAE